MGYEDFYEILAVRGHVQNFIKSCPKLHMTTNSDNEISLPYGFMDFGAQNFPEADFSIFELFTKI